MKTRHILLSALIAAAHAVAGELPSDVQAFVERRDGCEHFRGEPWDAGDDPEVRSRREFIFDSIARLCTGTDKALAKLRRKYRNNPGVLERLRRYEDSIEAQ